MKAVCQQTLFFKNWRINSQGVNTPLDVRGHSCPNLTWISDTAASGSPRGSGLFNHVHGGHSSSGLKYEPVNEFTFFTSQVLVRIPNLKISGLNIFKSESFLAPTEKSVCCFFFFLLKMNIHFIHFQSIETYLNCETWPCFPGAITGILHNPTKLLFMSSGESACLCWLAGPSRLIDLGDSGTDRQPWRRH